MNVKIEDCYLSRACQRDQGIPRKNLGSYRELRGSLVHGVWGKTARSPRKNLRMEPLYRFGFAIVQNHLGVLGVNGLSRNGHDYFSSPSIVNTI
jgi:hypothetical protein